MDENNRLTSTRLGQGVAVRASSLLRHTRGSWRTLRRCQPIWLPKGTAQEVIIKLNAAVQAAWPMQLCATDLLIKAQTSRRYLAADSSLFMVARLAVPAK
jgi:hypothetical protein